MSDLNRPMAGSAHTQAVPRSTPLGPTGVETPPLGFGLYVYLLLDS